MAIYLCRNCGEELSYTQHFRSPFCDNSACQRAKVQSYFVELDELKELNKKIEVTVKLRSQSYLANLPNDEKEKVAIAEEPNIALLPFNSTQLSQLNDNRKSEFLANLGALFQAIEDDTPLSSENYSDVLDDPLPDKDAILLGKACATCRGSCCRLGKEHAFQDYASLDYFLAKQSPPLQLKELMDLYKGYFPEVSYLNSCVFQGEHGCTLPRDLRSFTCKNYRCDALTTYHQGLITKDHDLTFAAAVEGEKIRIIQIFDKEHFITVHNNDIDCD